jgi:apolipoprotein N-acyltransferase
LKAPARSLGFLLAGAAQAVAIAAPWNGQPQWWLQLLSLLALVWLLDGLRQRPRERAPEGPRSLRPEVPGRSGGGGWGRGFLYGWLFAIGWLCGTFWWLFISLHTYGGLAAPLSALAVLVLAMGLGLYYALACSLFVARAPAGRLGSALFFAALWTLAELLRGYWFTGFPWGAGGYAHIDGPLSVYAPWIGVYGIGAVAAAIAALLALALRRAGGRSGAVPRGERPALGDGVQVAGGRAVQALDWSGVRAALLPLLLAAALLFAPVLVEVLRGTPADGATRSNGRVGVELLQGNIPQDEKFVPGAGIATALRWYGEQLQSATSALVITPETAIPLLPGELPRDYLETIAARYASGDQAALIGLPLGDGAGYSNSVLGFRPRAADLYRYDKHHLVPFGEFIPGLFRWFTDLLNIPLGDFTRGGLGQAPFAWKGQRIAPNVCYEDLFGEEIAANFVSDEQAPTILLNMSNIAWFGDSIAIDQHLAISRMRALEFQRPMVRATNTGATAVIDHRGYVVAALPRLTRGVLKAEVEGRTGRTPYAIWVSRYGLMPLWVLSLLAVGLVLLARLFRPGPASPAVFPG